MFRKAASSLVPAALALGLFAPAAHADVYVSAGYRPVYYAPPPPAPVAVYVRPAWWYMGAGVVGTSILSQDGGPEQLHGGGGLSLWMGANLSRQLSLELGWLGSFHNPIDVMTPYGHDTSYLLLQGVTLDAKVHLARGMVVDPYLQGGVGGYFMGDSLNGYADSSGFGYQFGAGVDLWAGRSVSLGARALFRGIALGPVDGSTTDTSIKVATVEGNVAFHF
jgi:hypothetical protein